MKNRLQLRYHFPDKLPTRNEAINYINDIFSFDTNDGLTSLIAEPLVVFYNNDTTLNRRRSIESANVILAIGRGGDGTNVAKNKDYFIIDFAKNVEDIYKINEIIGDVNDDKSKSSIYGLITKNLESIENEIIRAEEVEDKLFQSIEDAKIHLLSEINNNKKDISDEIFRATQAESDLMRRISEESSRATGVEMNLQEQITKNKVISSDKTIIVNTDSPSNTNISVNVDNSTIKIDERTGKLSVASEAFIKYDGENAIKITDKENYTKEISLVINPNDKILSDDNQGLKTTLSLEYVKDDENKPLLRLIGKDNETISSINVSDFINDGMIQSVELKEEQDKKYLVITWNTAAGKEITKLDISSLIDTYTAGNGINLNSGEFSIKLKTEQSLLKSDELGLYVNEDVLNNIIKSNTENLIDNKISERFNESKEYTNQQISEVEKDISYYISDLEKDIEKSEEDAKHYADDLAKEINYNIDNINNKINTELTKIESDINNLSSITNNQSTKLDTIENGAQVNVIETIKIAGNVINRNGKEVNIPLGAGLELDKNNHSINLQINEDFETTTEGISISNKFKNDIINNIDNKISGVTDAQAEKDAAQDGRLTAIEAAMGDWTAAEQSTKDAAQDAILAGFGVGQEFETVKDALYKKVDTANGFRLMSDAEGTKLEGIAEGAQVNVIETVQLNGVNLAVTEKTVNVVAIEGVGADEKVIILGADNKITTNLSIVYDSGAKEIKLMSGETQIGTAIDATDFIKDGMISNAELVAGKEEDGEKDKMFIEITFNSDAESEPIRIDVSSLVDAGVIANLELRVNANEDAIDDIEAAMGDWTAATQAEKDAAQDAILAGYGTEEGETATVRDDIENLQGQITDGDTATLESAKEYTDGELKKVTEAQAEKDAAQDAILAGFGGADEPTEVKRYVDDKFNKINLNGDIDTINNGISLINDENQCGILFTKDNEQRLITFDGLMNRFWDADYGKWQTDFQEVIKWGDLGNFESSKPEVDNNILNIKSNGKIEDNETLVMLNSNSYVEEGTLILK